jgi:short subunit dehydrogenase-like uncharacterized protein
MTERRHPDRPYDVVVFGATGFAGRLTAEYLARNAPPTLRWAMAGRDKAKLETVRARLGEIDTASADIDLLVADIGDESSIRTVAESTNVVITTVGPYVLYGEPIVAACADAGTDYVDLTGEPEFVNTTFVRHHERAVTTGARLVHACGFDSVPHDIGAYFTVQQLPDDSPIRMSGVVRASAMVSGGTLYSLLTALSRPRANAVAARERKAVDAGSSDGRRARAVAGRPHRDPVEGGWAIPLPTLDPQVIARSARALPRYGPDFAYSHYVSVPHLYTAAGGALGLAGLGLAAQIPPARRALLRRVAPGDGPSEAKRARSWFTVTFVGEGGGKRVVTRVSGGDPGYDETAKILAESALALALDDLPPTAGQVTTATAMGDALLARLTRAGIGFDVLAG